MINVKEAAKAATDFITSLYNTHELINLSLEEVELSDNGEFWYITLGYTRPLKVLPPRNTASALQGYLNQPTTEQVYKVITVRSHDGEVTSMKIRAPIAA